MVKDMRGDGMRQCSEYWNCWNFKNTPKTEHKRQPRKKNTQFLILCKKIKKRKKENFLIHIYISSFCFLTFNLKLHVFPTSHILTQRLHESNIKILMIYSYSVIINSSKNIYLHYIPFI